MRSPAGSAEGLTPPLPQTCLQLASGCLQRALKVLGRVLHRHGVGKPSRGVWGASQSILLHRTPPFRGMGCE